MAREWLDEKHPIYVAGMERMAIVPIAGTAIVAGEDRRSGERAAQIAAEAHAQMRGMLPTAGPWVRNERRLRGGDDVLDELQPFEWELPEGDAYNGRRAQATYINFPEIFVTSMVGQLAKKAPTPDGGGLTFGGLGDVRRKRDGATPTFAELVFYNATSPGRAGMTWHAFWKRAMRNAMGTGHRWIMVDVPKRPAGTNGPVTMAEAQRGVRPYLLEISPSLVTNWHDENGELQFAVVRTAPGAPKLDGEQFDKEARKRGYLLLVRRGFTGLGAEYAGGGWWRFSADREPTGERGTWDATDGDIPMFPLVYEEDEGTDERPAMSRSAITELGQLAVSYMNRTSEADWDAREAASSFQWLIGVDPTAFNVAMEKIRGGSRFVPLQVAAAALLGGNANANPIVQDGSVGAVVADVFDKRLLSKREEAALLAALEASSTPDSSGRSKEAGFAEVKSPRLALMAENLEAAQNNAVYFLERRFGVQQPAGYVVWPRDYDLAPVVDEIRSMLELQTEAGVVSPTLTARALTRAAQEKGLVTSDTEISTVEKEYTEALKDASDAAAQDRALQAALRESTRITGEEDDDEGGAGGAE